MGEQARLKRSRREQRRAAAELMTARDAEIRARPEIRAAFAAGAADEGLQAELAASGPGQVRRLSAAGWRQRLAGVDGAGVWDHRRTGLRLVHSASRQDDGKLWGQVSVSSAGGDLPGWYPLRNAQWLLYPGRYGLVVVAPEDRHVNIAQAAHVWTPLEGTVLPDFGRHGTI